MCYYDETFNTWNKVAELYQHKFMHLNLYNESYDAFCNSITVANASILEIGCGPGNITNYLLSKRADFRIVSTDMAPNMIALAKQNNPAAQFSVLNAQDVHQLHRKFNGIIAGFCIPYLSQTDTLKLLKDIYSLLENNGLL